jgi:gamma-glutamyl-gamma-aminobutyrate hydrolase PuuD
MKPPLILISPSTEKRGVEFEDLSISLSNKYSMAIALAGGLPWIAPALPSKSLVAASVARVDGIMLTGGDDLQPELYAEELSPELRRTVSEPEPERDLFELLLVEEVFRQRKPLFAICRGHQLVNVAFGGTLVVDIQTQIPGAFNHSRTDRKCSVVHDARLERGSLLAQIVGGKKLGVNSSHHQALAKVAEPFAVTARSSDGVIEAMELKAGATSLPFFLAVQFHPERLCERHTGHAKLFKSFVRASAENGKEL